MTMTVPWVRVLLANTHLTVRIKDTQSACFKTAQGDSLSLVLFTCYLAAALHAVQESTSWLNPPVSDLGMPLEWEYADEIDFANEKQRPLDFLLSTACNTLKNWNLLVNESKTEFTHIYLANAAQTDNDVKAVCGNEHWCYNKSLGSYLCSSTYVLHRCNLGTAAFHSLWAMWLRQSLITEKASNTVCALIFTGFIFRRFSIFTVFTLLNLQLGTVELKYSRVKYSRIYGVSLYTIIVYGSCRGAKLAGLDFQRHTWQSWLSGSLWWCYHIVPFSSTPWPPIRFAQLQPRT